MNDETPQDFNPQLAQLSGFLTYRISRLHQKINSQGTKILAAKVGITLNQWRMVAFIGGAKTVTASELVRYTAMDKGLVSRNVKSLIEDGLVVSREHREDSRVNLLSLTPRGKEVFDVALPTMRKRQKQLQSKLSDDDIKRLREMLDILEVAAEEVDI